MCVSDCPIRRVMTRVRTLSSRKTHYAVCIWLSTAPLRPRIQACTPKTSVYTIRANIRKTRQILIASATTRAGSVRRCAVFWHVGPPWRDKQAGPSDCRLEGDVGDQVVTSVSWRLSILTSIRFLFPGEYLCCSSSDSRDKLAEDENSIWRVAATSGVSSVKFTQGTASGKSPNQPVVEFL